LGIAVLVFGLVVFVATHVVTTLPGRRAALVKRLGEGPYKILYSLASLAGLLLIAYGFSIYRRAGYITVWSPPDVMRHVTILLTWPAMVLIVAAYVPSRLRHAAKHPMLAGVKLWAFAHLLSNGDLGSIILFGSLLGWAVYDRISVKRRGTAIAPAPAGWSGDLIAVAVGTVVYLALGFAFHPAVIGVPVFGR
jgi:uncharacterized membrane protein